MRRRLLSVVLMALILAPLVALAQQNDMKLWVGTWKRNLAKSNYSGTPPTGDQTVKLEIVNGLLQVTSTTVNAQGPTTTATYLVKFDGSERISNAQAEAAMTYTFVDARTYEGFAKVKGQLTTTTRYALAADGKTHTLTTTGKNAQGQVVHNVVLYEKQ